MARRPSTEDQALQLARFWCVGWKRPRPMTMSSLASALTYRLAKSLFR